MKHLAMIMDGNRRWAKENGVRDLYGEASKRSVRLAVEFCLKNKIEHLSLYAFSLENFNRSKTEQKILFRLLEKTIREELPKLMEQNVKIRFIGDKRVFPDNLKLFIQMAEEKTSGLNDLTLNILFCYGGQQELLFATKSIAQKVKAGLLNINEIDENTIRESLWIKDSPPPELILRTGGVHRLSNFLTFDSAYSEFMFLDCYWPDLTETHLQHCLDNFSGTIRNFGH
ncbi:di-trans,poly-cis-decaprenylcistransferase [Candidatus Babeliales bacterium]|nr:di-trans,poly-cis-decaprenylcistransferase [Candidatus Babeliales bacterium]